MNTPSNLRFSESHEWVDQATGTVGITFHAQEQLGDIVHVELPKVGRKVKAGESVAEVESVKAVSEIYSPISGTISAVNDALDGAEDAINKDPYVSGWLFRVTVDDASELNKLLDAAAYDQHAGH